MHHQTCQLLTYMLHRRHSTAASILPVDPAPACAAAPQIRVKCNEDDTIGDLKKMVAAQTGG